ncbi:carboxymuconolactone decarboxylase family protein [Vitiosangium sp. GDMCC 1.1324]|uniref:carboxymuconolactone decarboxylase family protein n=1 Tax=Vitiosangium sp. (strain GDMCC 1.1324) TaxID=2138576 RepID=UPI000D38C5EA|nr:peroxidase [Vitiosangium sp. GDMCC 1.1324]PTL83115.1 peroxidase [Vitiosangium sp. GDMCC 1.1324]
MLEDEQKVAAVLEDLDAAPIPEAERALFRFVEKVNRESEHIQQEDVDAVKAAGWTDEALYDAITVCALFNFYNRWADATGVRIHPAEVYERGAERLATAGYGGPPPGSPPPDKKP